MRTLSIIIPCFNEKGTIRELLEQVFAVSIPGWNIEIVIVDDGSKDGTQEILKSYENRAVIVYGAVNEGKGSAVAKGLAVSKGEYILIQDADLEYNPKEIPSLVTALPPSSLVSKTVVYGSRNLEKHSRKENLWIPRIGVWFITRLTNIYHGSKLTDVWTCYKLFPRESREHFTPGRFESEIIFTINLLKNDYKINEVSITHNPRSWSEGKKITYGDGLRAIWIILASRPLILLFIILCLLAILSLLFPHSWNMNDTPTYIEAMKVMQGGTIPAGFVPNRIMTTFLGLNTVIGLSYIFGTYFAGWVVMNLFFFFINSILFYKILRSFFSEVVAYLGTFFLAANYAFLTFGFSYLMDEGGWAGYITALYFLVRYIKSNAKKDLYWCALAIGIGGLYKEYAFLAYIALGFWMLYENRKHLWIAIKKMVAPTLVIFAPFVAVSFYVYFKYGYTYFSWFGSNEKSYVYTSRIIEYIKSFGSLYNLLSLVFLAGLYYFIRYDIKGWTRRKVDSIEGKSYDYVPFIICVVLSALPAFIWPAITQRILFITVPAAILVACCFIKKYEKYWYFFLATVVIYGIMNFTMDSYILGAINLPI